MRKLIIFTLFFLLASPAFSAIVGDTPLYATSNKRADGGFNVTANYVVKENIHPALLFNHYIGGIRQREYGIGCSYLFTPQTKGLIGVVYNYDRDSYQFIFNVEHKF